MIIIICIIPVFEGYLQIWENHCRFEMITVLDGDLPIGRIITELKDYYRAGMIITELEELLPCWMEIYRAGRIITVLGG